MDLRGERNLESRLLEIFMLGTLQFTKWLGVSDDAHNHSNRISQRATPKALQTSPPNYAAVLWSKAGSKFTRLSVCSSGVQSPQLV